MLLISQLTQNVFFEKLMCLPFLTGNNQHIFTFTQISYCAAINTYMPEKSCLITYTGLFELSALLSYIYPGIAVTSLLNIVNLRSIKLL